MLNIYYLKKIIVLSIPIIILILLIILVKNKEKYYTDNNWKDSELNILWDKLIHNTFVINLEKDFERKKHMENMLKSLNVKYTIWNAFDARKRSVQNYCVPLFSNNTVGEIGCAISHTKLIEKIAKDCNNDKSLLKKWFIIFEDDAAPNIKNYKKLKSTILNALVNLPDKYDILLLGSCFNDYWANNTKMINDHIWEIDSLCMHAYAIRGKISEKLSNVFNNHLCDMPVDVILKENMKGKVATLFKRKYNILSRYNQFIDNNCDNDDTYFCQGLFGQFKNNNSFKTNILKNSIFEDDRKLIMNDRFKEF